ncbi:hypothetical protein CWATWH0401_3085 [Crocosphaera watsonii WH 0401]|uniref:Uncharacterized protein n=1 Tax=Crocosphaera watsonii WH 0401 TaxID=555881 RepID=T2JDL5_CROWT|nr:hypothetical protein CWATWH0401_3085 [Crocosphaera watsonii WH 0401]
MSNKVMIKNQLFQLIFKSYQLSVIRYQLSVTSYQLSMS